MKTTITKLPNAEVEITGELPVADFAVYRPAALAALNEGVKIDGFRAGNIPEKVLLDHVGEERVLIEMAELAIQEWYPKMIEEHKLDAIGRPEISLTKLAKNNPLGFKIKTAVHPEITLPEVKPIAKKINEKPADEITITDKDVEDVLTELRKSRTEKDQPEPELTDTFAQSLGNFSGVDDLKTKIRANLKLEKEAKNKDKRRLEIVEAISQETKVELPTILIESELDKMVAEMKGQIEGMGLKFEEYLKHLKKEEKDLRADWRADAERRVKTALVLAKIAEVEKIGAPDEEVEKEVKHLKEHYKDAPEDRLRQYVANVLINEYVFRFLEEQK
jgi:FKBP-type peptidyl-prolyl cis-trans isomerase (trigger factor)